MPEAKQVFHMEPRITIAGGLNRHITRKQMVTEGGITRIETWVPKNADPEKTADNVELVSREYTDSDGKTHELTLQQAVDKRLSKDKIKRRKGQATCLEIIFTGSHDRMTAMDREGLLKWSDDIMEWSKKQWGKENIVSASLHVDERTPHIHMIVVPIVTGQSRRTRFHQEQNKSKKTYKINHDKPRLCKNEVYTIGKLNEYHDSLFEEVNKNYGLARGTKAEPGSKKKHQDSIDYNRQLAEEAAEQRALIAEVQADYTKIQDDIQDLQTKKDTLSSAVKEEQDKYDKAEAKAKKAEERLTTQQVEIEKNTGIINSQVADFNAKKKELNQTEADIDKNKKTIEGQKKTIAANDATIKSQEKIKSSTVISDDAAEEKILEKLLIVANLTAEEKSLKRSLTDKKKELATASANLKRVQQQMGAKVNLTDIPQKGLLGRYSTEDVDRFIESVELASLRQAMNYAPGYIDVSKDIQEENDRLRKVEDDYEDFMNSPERMQQRIVYLENESMRHRIAETLKYALKKAVEIIRFTVDKTTNGDDIFAKFTIEGRSVQYAGRITPEEKICYTSEPLNSLQELKNHWSDKIWYVLGTLNEIRQKREKEDTIKRYSTKLSRLIGIEIKVTDFLSNGKDYLLSATNGWKYLVQESGETYSTSDARVNSISDAYKLSVWNTIGNINNPPEIKQSFQIKHR